MFSQEIDNDSGQPKTISSRDYVFEPSQILYTGGIEQINAMLQRSQQANNTVQYPFMKELLDKECNEPSTQPV